MSNRASHPYIAHIVKSLELVEELFDLGHTEIALRRLRDLLYSVGPEARKKNEYQELDSYLTKTWKARRKVKDTDPLVLQGKQQAFDYDSAEIYFSIRSQLWLLMWDNGYMFDKFFFGGVKQDEFTI